MLGLAFGYNGVSRLTGDRSTGGAGSGGFGGGGMPGMNGEMPDYSGEFPAMDGAGGQGGRRRARGDERPRFRRRGQSEP
ncbi:hypothetical protein ACFSQ7_47810 [Paenibacillus rhizoplanae]